VLISNYIVKWFPWFNFLNEFYLIQFTMLFILYNLYCSSNLFYIIFYLLFQIVLFGVFLSYYQLELFTAFLWLTEFVVVFISILLVFYLNVYGGINTNNRFIFNFKTISLILLFFGYIFYYCFPSEFEFFLPIELNTMYLWDDFYHFLYNYILTDLHGIFVSYYFLNSFEFIFIGLVLLVGSLVCVNLNKNIRLNKVNSYNDLFLIFDFYKNFIKFIFMRKQNLVDQENHQPSSRIFKKK